MHITIGSLNKTKWNAVKNTFPQYKIVPIDVPSDVSPQPISDEETRNGAINRAINALKVYPDNIAIGLEGGIMHLNRELYLCNWGALVTPDKAVITASGARIKLPTAFNASFEEGLELSEIIDNYANKKDIRHHEGAVGIFTNGLVLRDEMFEHVVTLLKGQYEYWEKK